MLQLDWVNRAFLSLFAAVPQFLTLLPKDFQNLLGIARLFNAMDRHSAEWQHLVRNANVINQGVPLSEVITDIDGDSRDDMTHTTPDPAANE